MMRSQHAKELTANNYQNTVATVNHAVSTQLMSDDVNSSRSLAWLSVTTTSWACLGLWEPAGAQPGGLRIAGSYDRGAQARPQIGERYRSTQFPPSACFPASAQDGGPDIVLTLPIATTNRAWGVLALALPITAHLSLTLEYVGMWAALLGSALDRGELTASLTEQSETLRLGYERERILSQTVRELGCPVIPLVNELLLVPLIGLIDSERSGFIMSAVLQGIEQSRARAVLIDVTGVPLIDTQVANVLIQLARSAALLGSQVIMVGVRPEIASSMVGLGVDLSHLLTFPTLAVALNKLQQERRARMA
jgi:anti-anti-sigma regulatory factor